MTLAIAWLRQVNSTEELIVASDSRLSGGGRQWDAGPKIFTFARTDCIMCFAGNADYAYPALQQVSSYIQATPRASDRAMDLCDLRSNIIDVLNRLKGLITNRTTGLSEAEDLDVTFILAGYSVRMGQFVIWTIGYRREMGAFWYGTPATRRVSRLAVVGDCRAKFFKLLGTRVGSFDQDQRYDMEPFAALNDLTKDTSESSRSVGGPLQMVKIYKHSNLLPFCVYWRNNEERVLTYLGRPLMDYEFLRYKRIDPETLDVTDGYRYEPK